MADETVSSFISLLWESKGPLAKQLERSTVLMSELKKDMSPETYDGEKFRMGVVLTQVQGTGIVTETGTLNTPKTLDNTKTRIDVGIVHVPISFSTKLMKASDNSKAAWLDAVDGKMQLAEEAFRDVINEQWNQDGTALIGTITDTANSATVTISSPNYYWLYEGRIVDVLVRSSGAVLSAGRKIVSYDDTTGIVTLDASVNHDNTHGLYVEGSYGNALVGFGQIAGTTGTFQEVSRTTYPQWKGTDASPSSAADLVISRFDAAERKAQRRSGQVPDLWWGDPAVIDKFSQGLTVQAEWAGDAGELDVGWTGVKYRNKVLAREFAAPTGTLFGTLKRDVRILTLDNGPDWDQNDGSMFRRFARALPLEAWLVWMLNIGVRRCNSTVKVGSLNQAAA